MGDLHRPATFLSIALHLVWFGPDLHKLKLLTSLYEIIRRRTKSPLQPSSLPGP